VVGFLACGGATERTGSPSATLGLPTPTAQTVPAISPTPAIAPSPSTSATPSAGASGGVVVDLSLLDHLPATVDGLPVEADAVVSATIAASPGLSSDASAIALARVVAPGGDFAIASIVRLRSGPFSDASFELWRTTYDQAACEPAGGLAASHEQQIGGRQVFVGACNGGAETYHVALTRDILVSITAIGSRHLGDLLVAALRE
jgi:hypothetical protein